MMMFSSSSGFICPWPMAMRQSGTYLCMRQQSRGDWKYGRWRNTPVHCGSSRSWWHRRWFHDHKVASSVWMGYRFGGVRMMLMSRAPISENRNVRGIGVADMVRVSTLLLSCGVSLVETPNFCSHRWWAIPGRASHSLLMSLFEEYLRGYLFFLL